MKVGWEPGGCGWGGHSRGRVQQLRKPCHPCHPRPLVLMIFSMFVPVDLRQRVGGVEGEEVRKVVRGQVVKGFVCGEEYFEVYSVLDREPVEVV